MMKRALTAASAAALFLLSVASPADGLKSVPVTTASEHLKALHEAMMNGMAGIHTLNMSGDTDTDIATVIVHHYRQTIALAEIELRHGKNAESRKAAQNVIAASEKQIADLRKLQSAIAKRS